MDFLRFGVVGIKGMGHGHLKTVTSSPVARLGAICDIDLAAAKRCKEEFGIDVPVFEQYEDMLKEAEIDAVAIATPHYLHCPMAVAAAEVGKHVLTEKPMAISVAECDEMIRACKKAGVVLGIGHQRRWSAGVRGMKKVLSDGTLGRPIRFHWSTAGIRTEAYYASGDWRGRWDQEGGGCLINQFVHDLDQICYLIGHPIEVAAWAANWGHRHEVDDLALAIVRFASGWIGTISLSLVSAGGQGAVPNVFEGDLALVNGSKLARRSMPATQFIADSPQQKPTLGEFSDIPPAPLEKQGRDLYYENFLGAVNGKESFEGPGEECIWAVELVNGIFLSTLTGKRVSLPLDRGEVKGMFRDLVAKRQTLPRVR